MEPIDRFLDKVTVDDTTCWLWGASIRSDGYVNFRASEGTKLAHRFAYEHFREPIPQGLTLDHLCRVRHCVNPWHLQVTTLRENILRGTAPSARQAQQTHCKRGHSLGPDGDVYNAPDGQRICRVCRREREARYRGH